MFRVQSCASYLFYMITLKYSTFQASQAVL
jgi:hypothetical protein